MSDSDSSEIVNLLIRGAVDKYGLKAAEIRKALSRTLDKTFSVFITEKGSGWASNYYYSSECGYVEINGYNVLAYYHKSTPTDAVNQSVNKWLTNEYGWTKPNAASHLRYSIRDKLKQTFSAYRFAILVAKSSSIYDCSYYGKVWHSKPDSTYSVYFCQQYND